MTSPIQPAASPTGRPFRLAPLLWLALGTFATGTESFMISPLLPNLAGDLHVSVTGAGQLVTVFALTYALTSPILSAATGGVNRRKLLLASMTAFALANLLACIAGGYGQLMAARVLLACAAGLYVPSASALAGSIVAPDHRGRALAIVNGGTSVAVTFGVPAGALIGHALGWRATFIGVGMLATLAVIGLAIGIRRGIDSGLPAPSLRERVAVIKQAPILLTLAVTALWATGAYTVYTYLAAYMTSVIGIAESHIAPVMFIWGVASVAGLFAGGTLNDRLGARAVIVPAFLLLAAAFVSLTAIGLLLHGALALAVALGAIVVWGLSAWSFFPAQQARLVQAAGIKAAPVALALNASFMYLGFSLGAVLGSFTMLHAGATHLGVVGAACEIVALGLALVTMRRSALAVSEAA